MKTYSIKTINPQSGVVISDTKIDCTSVIIEGGSILIYNGSTIIGILPGAITIIQFVSETSI